MSKGSSQRPTDSKAYSDNWDKIFSKDQVMCVKQDKQETSVSDKNCQSVGEVMITLEMALSILHANDIAEGEELEGVNNDVKRLIIKLFPDIRDQYCGLGLVLDPCGDPMAKIHVMNGVKL